jgi:hypothetical protein
MKLGENKDISLAAVVVVSPPSPSSVKRESHVSAPKESGAEETATYLSKAMDIF